MAKKNGWSYISIKREERTKQDDETRIDMQITKLSIFTKTREIPWALC